MTAKMRWQPKDQNAGGGAQDHAIKTTTAARVNPDAEDPLGTHAVMKIAGKTTETMTMSHAQDGDAVVAIARSPTETIHDGSAVMFQLGWKPSNYSSMPILRIIKTPKVVVVAAAAADADDNHLMWSAGGFR